MAIHAPNEIQLNICRFAFRITFGCPIWDNRLSVWDISQSEYPTDNSAISCDPLEGNSRM